VTFSIKQDLRGLLAAPRSGKGPASPAESAGRTIAIALGCILLAFVGAFVGGIVAGLFAVVLRRSAQAAQLCSGSACARALANALRLLALQAGALGTALVLFFSSLARARTIGLGERRVGLGDAPMERLPVILALTIAMAAYAIVVAVAYYRLRPDRLSPSLSASGWLFVTWLTVVIIVSPVAEELFFRGWLWVGLQSHWSVVPTALFTGVLWAAIHIDGGLARPFLLLPVALILSAARHFGESVRAPIMLHALYNMIVLSPPWHLKWLGLI
jgi:membrane protease YdiL (CAAX protease family)